MSFLKKLFGRSEEPVNPQPIIPEMDKPAPKTDYYPWLDRVREAGLKPDMPPTKHNYQNTCLLGFGQVGETILSHIKANLQTDNEGHLPDNLLLLTLDLTEAERPVNSQLEDHERLVLTCHPQDYQAEQWHQRWWDPAKTQNSFSINQRKPRRDARLAVFGAVQGQQNWGNLTDFLQNRLNHFQSTEPYEIILIASLTDDIATGMLWDVAYLVQHLPRTPRPGAISLVMPLSWDNWKPHKAQIAGSLLRELNRLSKPGIDRLHQYVAQPSTKFSTNWLCQSNQTTPYSYLYLIHDDFSLLKNEASSSQSFFAAERSATEPDLHQLTADALTALLDQEVAKYLQTAIRANWRSKVSTKDTLVSSLSSYRLELPYKAIRTYFGYKLLASVVASWQEQETTQPPTQVELMAFLKGVDDYLQPFDLWHRFVTLVETKHLPEADKPYWENSSWRNHAELIFASNLANQLNYLLNEQQANWSEITQFLQALERFIRKSYINPRPKEMSILQRNCQKIVNLCLEEVKNWQTKLYPTDPYTMGGMVKEQTLHQILEEAVNHWQSTIGPQQSMVRYVHHFDQLDPLYDEHIKPQQTELQKQLCWRWSIPQSDQSQLMLLLPLLNSDKVETYHHQEVESAESLVQFRQRLFELTAPFTRAMRDYFSRPQRWQTILLPESVRKSVERGELTQLHVENYPVNLHVFEHTANPERQYANTIHLSHPNPFYQQIISVLDPVPLEKTAMWQKVFAGKSRVYKPEPDLHILPADIEAATLEKNPSMGSNSVIFEPYFVELLADIELARIFACAYLVEAIQPINDVDQRWHWVTNQQILDSAYPVESKLLQAMRAFVYPLDKQPLIGYKRDEYIKTWDKEWQEVWKTTRPPDEVINIDDLQQEIKEERILPLRQSPVSGEPEISYLLEHVLRKLI